MDDKNMETSNLKDNEKDKIKRTGRRMSFKERKKTERKEKKFPSFFVNIDQKSISDEKRKREISFLKRRLK